MQTYDNENVAMRTSFMIIDIVPLSAVRLGSCASSELVPDVITK